MRNAPVQVIMAASKTQEGVQEAYKTLKMIKREKLLTFKDAALQHRDLRNKIHFGTALFVALLTAGMGALMASFMASTPGATEAVALSSALSMLAWISLIATLVTYLVASRLPKPQASQKSPIGKS